MNWKAVVGQRVRRLTATEALGRITAIRERGATIDQPAVRELTGGYASQSINQYVIRKLAIKAGLIKRTA